MPKPTRHSERMDDALADALKGLLGDPSKWGELENRIAQGVLDLAEDMSNHEMSELEMTLLNLEQWHCGRQG